MKVFRRRESNSVDRDRRLAQIRLHMLVAMATVDGRVPLCEFDLLHQSVEAIGCGHAHRAELEALLFSLLDEPPAAEQVARMVHDDPIAREHARTILGDLLRMALSDGTVEPAEQEFFDDVQQALCAVPAVAA